MILASSRIAAAAEPEPAYPLSQASRPLTLPRLMLAPELDLDISRRQYAKNAADLVGGFNLGVSFGITRDFEIGTLVLPLRFGDGVTYGSERLETANVRFHAMYRMFESKAAEIGVRLQAHVITTTHPGAQITASLPLRFHLGTLARLDLAPGAVVTARACVDHDDCGNSFKPLSYSIVLQTGMAVGLSVPLEIALSPIAPLCFGVRSGFELRSFYTFHLYGAVPVGLFAGYTVGRGTPLVDIETFVYFPDALLLPGLAYWDDNLIGTAASYTIGVGVRGYLDLR
jgi:hypothetical protein